MIDKLNELEKLIGNTKVIKANNLMEKYNLQNNIYLKIESTNFSGSIKDRLVYYIIKNAVINNLINKNTVIIEATSGNTGISIAAIANYIGIKCIIVMPNNVSIERIKMLEHFNAQVILTPADKGMSECILKVNELKKDYTNSFSLDQFNNPLGVEVHYKTTGKEIYDEINDIDIFVAGIGTGTTFTGCAKYLKEQNKDIICVGIEPLSSNVLNNGKKGVHKIEGIGAGFIPKVLDLNYLDNIVDVSDIDAYTFTKELYLLEDLKCGISSGAAIYSAIQLDKEYKNKNILIILPDDGNRYISKGVFNIATIQN